MTLGELYKRMRKCAGMSQAEMAKAFGMTQGEISQIECEKIDPEIYADDWFFVCAEKFATRLPEYQRGKYEMEELERRREQRRQDDEAYDRLFPQTDGSSDRLESVGSEPDSPETD